MSTRVCSIAVLTVLVSIPSSAQSPARGGDTPQAVMAAMQKAIAADDLAAATALVSAAGRIEFAREGVEGLLMALAFTNPDDRMPGAKPLPASELETKRKGYKSAVELTRSTLKPYGLDALIGKPVMAPANQKVIDSALAKADTVALTTSLVSALNQIGPLLGMTEKGGKKVPFAFGPVSNFKVTGDTATAKAGAETLDFVREQGRWFLSPPAAPPK
jgi:hypothetical protein